MKFVIAVTAAVLALTLAPSASSPAEAAAKPNVVFILTDDMRLDDLRYMPFTRRLFRRQGTEFTHALSPHPMCCPARAELVTGQYAQNNGVHHNRGEWGGYRSLASRSDLLFQWFRRDGYETAYLGKFMNGYHSDDPSELWLPGLTHNDASVRRVYAPRRVITYNNGNPTMRRGHQTSYVTRRARSVISRADGPFLLWAGYIAPHAMPNRKGGWGPPVPPKGYDSFRRRGHRRPPATRLPSYNAPNAVAPHLPTLGRHKIRELHRGRVLSLYAVDDGVRSIVQTLKKQGEYDNTILVFASDNGMGMGAHRVVEKNWAYQDVVRIPLLMTGPGVPADHEISSVTTLVDLPGTLARLTGVTPMRPQDGGDLFHQPADRAVLIQAGSVAHPWEWRGVYTSRYTYVRWHDGTVEFYDRSTDPYELTNLPRDPRAARLQDTLDQLVSCAGASCHTTWEDR